MLLKAFSRIGVFMENKSDENVTDSSPGKEYCLKRNNEEEHCKV